MLHKFDHHVAKKSITYATTTSTRDLKTRGGVGHGARRLRVMTAGSLWVKYAGDWSEEQVEAEPGEIIDQDVAQIAFGNPAVRTSGAGSYPAANLGGKTMVIRLDSGLDLDLGSNVTVTFQNSDTTQALIIARINEALNAAMPEPGGHPARAFAGDAGGGTTSITSRSRGSAATVQIVSIHADVATATGFSAGTSNGTQFAGPANKVRVSW